jgi:uncharacterized membrane protein YfcA
MTPAWVVLYLAIGLLIGLMSGILGIGGGVMLVPILIWCGFKYKQAVGTSIAVLVPPIGLPAAWKHFRDGNVDLGVVLCIAAAFVVGAYLGTFLIEDFDPRIFRLFFGLFLIFIALRFILSGSEETTAAAAGLAAALASLFAYAVLYLLGKRHLSARANETNDPGGEQWDQQSSSFDLGLKIRTSRDEGYADPDYYI